MTAAPFVAHFSRWRRGAGLLLAAGFVALGLWIAGAIGSIETPSPPIGWLSVSVFGFFGAVGLWRLGLSGDAVRIDRDGISIWRPRGSVAIPWHDVIAIDEIAVHRQRFLALTLASPERYRKPGAAGRIEAGMGFGDVSIGVQATDARFADLLAAVERFRPGG